mgnify:CR=1 FL=1
MARPKFNFISRLKRLLLVLLILPVFYSGHDHLTQLERVEQRGALIMLTRNGASTYYLGAHGPTGPEVELALEFATYLGVELEIVTATAFNQLSGMLQAGHGDLIAANLTRTTERELQFNFGPDYMQTSTVVVYRRGQSRPRSLADLAGRKIMVIAGSSYEEALRRAKQEVAGIEWEARTDVGMEELLLAVSDGAIDITLVDTNILNLNGNFYPRVASGFTLPGTLPHAWAFRAGSDDSLVQKSRTFLYQFNHQGRLDALHKSFYDPVDRMDQVNMYQFLNQVRQRLPKLVPLFQQAAEATGVDWRLLAAIGYQESHWNPAASSYTGVRGIMMLTRATARQLGVSNRRDPAQSIEGGARYFRDLRKRIPDRIPEPDRSWMALAAYNMGMGHLEDVRVMTQRQGGNADRWEDIDQRLDLLAQEKYYRDTRYGYARGFEARQYVANIREYYDTLVWMDTREHPLMATDL